jgi:hypothetical protein
MVDFNAINPYMGDRKQSFEEFVSQLARREKIPNAQIFVRNGRPDAGCECYWLLNDGKEWAWQAKYFTQSLEKSQFDQIESSIKTAIKKHPNISKYYIAMPIDPPDARVDNRESMRAKWEQHILNWQKEYPNVEFVVWWASDLINILQRLENIGFVKFWFGKEVFTEKWFQEQNYINIKDLGQRYTPEINIELDINKIFDGIAADEVFHSQYKEYLLAFLKSLMNIPKTDVAFDSFIQAIAEEAKKLKENFEKTIGHLDFKSIDKSSCLISEKLSSLNELLQEKIISIISNKEFKDPEKIKIKENYDFFNTRLSDVNSSFHQLFGFIKGASAQLYDNPYLLLQGEAGSGKSHLLADIVLKRCAKQQDSILLLGQKFKDTRDPKIQILEQLGLQCSFDDLLEALQCVSEIKQKRIILFIDALNEGAGKSFWQDYLSGIVEKLRKFNGLGLVCSLRSTYIAIFEENIKNSNFVKYSHEGFDSIEFEATKKFLSYYKIESPNIPLFNPEFSNPLFLKLFCEGLNSLGIHKITDGFLEISNVFGFFIQAINKKLLGERASMKLVNAAIDCILKYEINNSTNVILYDTAIELLEPLQQKYNKGSSLLLEDLISEGILIKDANYRKNEFIDIGYERLKDYLIAERLLNKSITLSKKQLKMFFKNPEYYQGVVDALAVLLPNNEGPEIFDVLSSDRLKDVVCRAFLKSLLWRRWKTFKPERVSWYIDEVILKDNYAHDNFYDILIYSSTAPKSFFNALKAHEYLTKQSLPLRDAWWIPFINDRFADKNTPLFRLIDWAYDAEERPYISDESMELSAIMLAWILASSNRAARDKVTRALVRLLSNRPHLTIKLLKRFEGINDPYIYERIYAVAYGVVLCAEKHDYLKELAEYIYQSVFNKDFVYPHVLLRDYARGVIEYALSLKVSLEIDVVKIRPSYKSIFPSIPSDDEIKKYEIDYEIAAKNPKLYGISLILSSMRPEHTRDGSGGMYGDFGRYIFQSAISHFIDKTKTEENCIQDMVNIVIKRIFDLGYNADIHGEYDHWMANRSVSRHDSINERIGKKYQWISMHELLAQLADNYKMRDDSSWPDKNEVNFEGPWEPYVRDVDPSNTAICYTEEIPTEQKYENWNVSNNQWVKISEDLPDPKNLFLADKNKWVLLNGFYQWDEPKELGQEKYSSPSKELFYILNSYFVPLEQYEVVSQWLGKQNLGGRWLPEKGERYELLNREFAWAPSFKFFLDSRYFNGLEKHQLSEEKTLEEIVEEKPGLVLKVTNGKDEIIDEIRIPPQKIYKKEKKIIGDIFYTVTSRYLYERERDLSDEKKLHCSIKKPCLMLFEYFKLKYKKYENCLYTPTDELACVDLGGKLYFRRDLMDIFLKANNLSFLWTLLGEKNIVKPDYSGKRPHSKLTISGIYTYFSDNNIKGSMKADLKTF